MKKNLVQIIAAFFLLGLASVHSASAAQRLRLATTTSTDNSGLLKVLHPVFEHQFTVIIDVIAVGTGKAIKLAENGDVDVILVHAPAAEKRFVESGYGLDRKAVMHNDFVIVGTKSDPANIKSAGTLNEAVKRIARLKATFISRGDDSGTHKKEKAIWTTAGLTPAGSWYLSVGQGMGAVLRIANDKQAYALTDRGTWLAYQNQLDLVVVKEGDPVLFNPYHVIAINPKRHPHAKYKLATKYINFITGAEGQAIIQNHKVNGKQLFYPDTVVEQ